MLDSLREFSKRHAIDTIVSTSHGSSGVLVDDDGPVMPVMDYEQNPPAAIDEGYYPIGAALQNGPLLGGTQHLARQLFWLEAEWPQALARAKYFLGGPQYWAWRLSGVAATELTYLGAQSHLWDVPARRYTKVVEERGWRRLFPEIKPAWSRLGKLRTELSHRYGIPNDIEVLCGIHDSSANFYRYQQSGLSDLAVVSTGTWIVGLRDGIGREAKVPETRVNWNADVHGEPLAGVLTMGGRDFSLIAGEGLDRPVEAYDISNLIDAGTMALPSFTNLDAMIPGSAGRGRIVGPKPETPTGRRALALLYVALLTDLCLDLMGTAATTVLDGTFIRDRLYVDLVAALRPGRIVFSTDAYGTAAGAALLADHSMRDLGEKVELGVPKVMLLPKLPQYQERWRELAGS